MSPVENENAGIKKKKRRMLRDLTFSRNIEREQNWTKQADIYRNFKISHDMFSRI